LAVLADPVAMPADLVSVRKDYRWREGADEAAAEAARERADAAWRAEHPGEVWGGYGWVSPAEAERRPGRPAKGSDEAKALYGRPGWTRTRRDRGPSDPVSPDVKMSAPAVKFLEPSEVKADIRGNAEAVLADRKQRADAARAEAAERAAGPVAPAWTGAVCAECGAPVRVSAARFCIRCGSPVQQGTPEEPAREERVPSPPVPEPDAQPVPVPVQQPAPEARKRCAKCGYWKDSQGHLVSCGVRRAS
jgi:hypothetical protein